MIPAGAQIIGIQKAPEPAIERLDTHESRAGARLRVECAKATITPPGWTLVLPRLIEISEVRIGRGVLKRCSPTEIPVLISSCGDYFTAEVKDIEMNITESSVEGLKDAVEAVLGMKWKRYAEGNPDKMTPRAQKIRNRLRAMYSYDLGT